MRLLKWLGQYNKFLVALTMTVLYWFQGYTGMELPVGEIEVSMFWMFITSVLVYFIPNIKGDK